MDRLSPMIRRDPISAVRCQWGEGPLWWRDALYFVDIEGRAIHRYDPETGTVETWNAGRRIGFIAPRAAGGFVVGGDNGLFFFDDAVGSFTPVVDPEADKPGNRFNDGKCAPDGRLFAGTISLEKRNGDARLYRLDADGAVSEAFGPVTNSNGLAWSADAGTLYYIDTPRREVLAFWYADGELTEMRTAFSTGHIDASPDGMCIDRDGHLWIAFCHGGCVCCFDPATGDEIRRIALPCLETTSCAFGGPDFSDLYVTTGVHKTAKEEHAGHLFVIRGLGVKGLPAAAYAG
jgi:sugar lactone lactonase YvrE